MLLPDNVHPENSIYYNGAFVLKSIGQKSPQKMMDLYLHSKSLKEMSMPVFVLCLDWLFLLEIVALNEMGEVELCS
jgi:hypothetical protein